MKRKIQLIKFRVMVRFSGLANSLRSEYKEEKAKEASSFNLETEHEQIKMHLRQTTKKNKIEREKG